ncbi:MAG: hypothetical protein IJV00_02830 [Clostridia bacterium]|nr:hypothetical protein [Clostridia bacterium]
MTLKQRSAIAQLFKFAGLEIVLIGFSFGAYYLADFLLAAHNTVFTILSVAVIIAGGIAAICAVFALPCAVAEDEFEMKAYVAVPLILLFGALFIVIPVGLLIRAFSTKKEKVEK